MKVTAFIQLRRTRTPTGVGVHIIQMTRGLNACSEIDLNVLVSQKELDNLGKISDQFSLTELTPITYPFSRITMERLWRLVHSPKADRYCPDADWVYCPAETYVPTAKPKCAATIHDMYPCETNLPWSQTPAHRQIRKSWQRRIKQILAHADLILTVSDFSKKRIVALTGFDPSRIAVVGNGVAPNFYQANKQINKQINEKVDNQTKKLLSLLVRDQPYLMVVGGLTQRKRGDAILNVAQALLDQASDVQVVVAGKNEAAYLQRATLLPNVHLLGYVLEEDLPHLMHASTALLFLSEYEGFGMPAAEAMAVGTVPICASKASLPEVVGNAGILVDPNASKEIADLAHQLATHPTERQPWIEKALKRAERFTWDQCVGRLHAALKKHT